MRRGHCCKQTSFNFFGHTARNSLERAALSIDNKLLIHSEVKPSLVSLLSVPSSFQLFSPSLFLFCILKEPRCVHSKHGHLLFCLYLVLMFFFDAMSVA